jgi:hypothetical protein
MLQDKPTGTVGLHDFLTLRNRVFAERKELIEERHRKERHFFDGSPGLGGLQEE